MATRGASQEACVYRGAIIGQNMVVIAANAPELSIKVLYPLIRFQLYRRECSLSVEE